MAVICNLSDHLVLQIMVNFIVIFIPSSMHFTVMRQMCYLQACIYTFLLSHISEMIELICSYNYPVMKTDDTNRGCNINT